jgi:hypothetical protein
LDCHMDGPSHPDQAGTCVRVFDQQNSRKPRKIHVDELFHLRVGESRCADCSWRIKAYSHSHFQLIGPRKGTIAGPGVRTFAFRAIEASREETIRLQRFQPGASRADKTVSFRFNIRAPELVACTDDAKECPGGVYVSRDPAHNCEFPSCPKPPQCSEWDCGPQPGMPNSLCWDGVTLAGPGACERQENGQCGWTIVSCPPKPYVMCTADVKECPDGTYVGRNPARNCEFYVCPEAPLY